MGKAKKAAAVDAASPATSATKTKTFQVFDRLTAKRSQLHFHEQNPRTQDKHAAKKLREFIRKHGLLGSLIVNRRRESNGFPPEQEGMLVFVGGHQRATQMDILRDYPAGGVAADYDIPIDVLEVTPAKELSYLTALNNLGLQGTWDHDLLEQVAIAIAGFEDGDIRDTGFERADLGILFDEGVLDEIFGVDPQVAAQVEAQAPTLEMLEEIRQAGKGAKTDRKASRGSGDADRPPDEGGDDTTDDPAGDGDAVDPSDPPDSEANTPADSAELARMKRERTAYRERVAEQNESEFMLVLVAENEAQLERWMLKMRLPRERRYLSLSEFCSKTGLEIDEE